MPCGWLIIKKPRPEPQLTDGRLSNDTMPEGIDTARRHQRSIGMMRADFRVVANGGVLPMRDAEALLAT